MLDHASFLSLGAVSVAWILAAFAVRYDLGAPLRVGLPALALGIAGLASALTLAGLDWRAALVCAALGAVCALIAEIDRRHHIIPDPLVAGVACLALAAPFGDPLWLRAAGAAVLGALFLGVHLLFAARKQPDALGLGDVKLAGALGALVGPHFGLIAVALAGAATMAALGVLPRPATSPDAKYVGLGAPFGIALAGALMGVTAWRLWINP